METNSKENLVKKEDEPPDGQKNNNHRWKWRRWHEREHPVKIKSKITKKGIRIEIHSEQLNKDLFLEYPGSIWYRFPKENKIKLLDNIAYIFTAHLLFLLNGNIRLEYNTGYPHSYSWSIQCFVRFLSAYWYLYRGRRGSTIFPLLKTILNSRAYFSETKDIPPRFPVSIDNNVIIPFTFGKDSFLTYHIAKKIGLSPILIYFNEPTEEYAKKHKLDLIRKFTKEANEKVYFLENPLGTLREYGEGWFGWELALTSWALLSLPFAYHKKAGYIIFSNEASCNDFFYDSENLKVIPDYEQSGQATEELSHLTQALSEGEIYTTTFLQGLNEITIVAILKHLYPSSFKYLMSCWAEIEAAKNKRWCCECSKCARIYSYLVANGIDPIKEAGFKDNMFALKKESLFNVFGGKAAGTGWDAFGLNTEEQAFAFYIAYLRGNRDPLVKKFKKAKMYKHIEENFKKCVDEYLKLHEEHITPKQWKGKINKIFETELVKVRKEVRSLRKAAKVN